MADISVTLQLNDAQYLKGIKTAEAASAKFSKTVNTGLASNTAAFNSLNTAVAGVNTKLQGLTSAIIGVGIVDFASRLLNTSNTLKDMSAALDISIASMAEIGIAASQSGSSIDSVSGMMNRMVTAASDANEGNLDLVGAFRQVGVSIADLKSQGPDVVFNRIATELAAISDPGTRAARAVELFGKGARGFDWIGYAQSIKDVTGTMGPYEEAIKRASAVSEALKTQATLTQYAFIDLLDPILKIIAPTGTMADKMEAAEKTAKALGVALAVFTGAAIINAINTIVGAVVSLGGALGVTTVATTGETAAVAANTLAQNSNNIVRQLGVAAKVEALAASLAMAQARALETAGTLAEAGALRTVESLTWRLAVAKGALAEATVIATGAQTAQNASMVAAGGAAAVASTGIGALLISMARFAGIAALITGAVYLVNEAFRNFDIGLGKGVGPIDWLAGKLEKITKEYLPSVHAGISKLGSMLGMTPIEQTPAAVPAGYPPFVPPPPGAKPPPPPKPTTPTITGETSNPALAAAVAQAKEIRKQIELSKELNNTQIVRAKLANDTLTWNRADREEMLTAFDASQKYLADYRKIQGDIAKIDAQMAAVTGTGKKEKIAALAVTKKAYQDQLAALENIAPLLAKIKREEIERLDAIERTAMYLEIEKKAKENVLSVQQSIDDLTKTSTQTQLDNIDRMIAKEKELAKEKLQAQVGAGNPINVALLEQAIRKVDAAYAGLRPKTEEFIAKGREFSTGWAQAYNEYADAAYNAATNAKNIFAATTKGMEDMIVNFTKTGKLEFKSFLGSIVEQILRSQIQQLLAKQFAGFNAGAGGGDILSTLFSAGKSLLGLAGGGMVPNNGPVLVGERGPEILTGAGGRSVIPNDALGGSTNITYNINAVDASSFRNLVASDPEFIFAVTEQGRRRQPGQRR